MSKFYGDTTRWFIGVVESTTPPRPELHGKVQVRIHGIHDINRISESPQAWLPWAVVLAPSNVSTPPAPGMRVGSLVYGVFLDGTDSQQPMIIGVIPNSGSSSSTQNSNGISMSERLSQLPTDDSEIGDGHDYSNISGPSLGGDTNKTPAIEILDVGAGWNVIKRADGSVEKRIGNRNWRNNNPGNIKAGDFTRSQGAIGSDGEFAIFPSYEVGRAAKSYLIFESSAYRNLDLAAMIAKYAPPSENDTASYYRDLVKSVGGVNQPMYLYTSAQREIILNVIQKREGFVVGRVEVIQEQKTVDDVKKFPLILSSDDLSKHINSTPRDMPRMIVHWTQTYNDKYLTATDLDLIDTKSKLDGIQYHLIIRRDGTIQAGRDINKTNLDGDGALSVAFVGGLNCPAGTKAPQRYLDVASISVEQFKKFDMIVKAYLLNEPTGTIVGRSATDPGFDVPDYVKKFKK